MLGKVGGIRGQVGQNDRARERAATSIWGAMTKTHLQSRKTVLYVLNTPILGDQKRLCWHFWCAGICVRCATTDTPENPPKGIARCKQTHRRCTKTPSLALLAQKYARLITEMQLRSPPKWPCVFQTQPTRYPRTPWMAPLVQRSVRSARATT